MDLQRYQQPHIIQAALAQRRIAIVGLSSNQLRGSYFVGYYLRRHGYEIVPVNPREQEILGKKCYPSLSDVAEAVGVCACSARPRRCPPLPKKPLPWACRICGCSTR